VPGEQLRVHEPGDLLDAQRPVAVEVDPREVADEVVARRLDAALHQLDAVAPVGNRAGRALQLLLG
jgi:hypothetical protein